MVAERSNVWPEHTGEELEAVTVQPHNGSFGLRTVTVEVPIPEPVAFVPSTV